jgi:hypothetical protein
MGLDITHMLTKSTSPFYGIVSGNAAIPLGSVVLPVTFGESRENYRTEYIKFEVAEYKNLAEQLIRRAKSYVLVGDKLYRRGASSGVLMKCVPRQEGKDILEEIHKGVCGNHASSRTLVSKAFRRDFYWPTALGDAEELVRRYQGCQYFAKQQHVPAYKLVTIPPTWPLFCNRRHLLQQLCVLLVSTVGG